MKALAKRLLSSGVFIVLLSLHNPSYGEAVMLDIANNISATADFRQGEKDKPAVFLLHGFMSTRNLNIIQVIAEELAGKGYTVLAPTLSLNINNRRSGLKCDAIHTHTMDSDVNEIGKWIDWLKIKGYKNIIMAGFSTGALQASIYLARSKPIGIKKAILISPAYLSGAPFPVEKDKTEIAFAKKLVSENNEQLQNFDLSYCKGNFHAPPKVFLSYKKWTDSQLIKIIKQVPVPISIIIGGGDHRFASRLVGQLKKIHPDLIKIPEANHFYDSPHEFEFLDKLTEAIES